MVDIANISALLLENAGQPRRAAQKTLDWLLARTRARSVALFRVEGDEIALSLGMAIDSLSEVQARELWEGRGQMSEAPLWGEEGTVVLVRTHPADMLVYADGIDRRTLDLPALVMTAAIAARALTKAPSHSDDGGGLGLAKREELLQALKLHEWNIARVSRAMQVTRKTTYERMERYGIERERVPK